MTDGLTNSDPGASAAATRDRFVRLLDRCAQRLRADLIPLLDITLARLDDVLSELADKAENNRRYSAYVESVRLLRQERGELRRRFLETIDEATARFRMTHRGLRQPAHQDNARQALDSPSITADDLSLVADADLEESLLLSNLVSKADSRYVVSLRELTHHFGTLLNDPDLKRESLPLSPHALCQALQGAVRSIPELPLSTVLVTYKVFDQQVMDRLGPTFTACLGFAHALGLQPQGRLARPVIAPDPTSARARAAAPATPDPNPRGPASRSDLLSLAPRTDGPTVGSAVPDPTTRPARASAADGRRQLNATTTDRAAARAGSAPPGAEQRTSLTPRVPTFNQLRALLHAGPMSLLSAAPAEDGVIATLVETNELLHELSRLQQAVLTDADDALTPGVLRQAVAAELRGLSARDPAAQGGGNATGVGSAPDRGSATGTQPLRQLARRDADTMDLVFLLFEQILAAPDLPNRIKLLVSRLQIPYLKLALVDPGLFEDQTHPARAFLNRIATVAIGWADDGQPLEDPLYTLLRHSVERVITELHTEPHLFAQLDQALRAYAHQIEQEALRAETRTLRTAEARAQQQAARRRVMAAIGARLAGKTEVPVVVAAIVYDGWVEVMLKLAAEQGEDGPGSRHALQVLERLLWSVEPKRDASERRELLRRIPELLRNLRALLGDVVTDQRQLAGWLKDLQTVHIAVLRGPPGEAGAGVAVADLLAANPSAPGAPPTSMTDEGPIPPAAVVGTTVAHGADSESEEINRLPIGTWIALSRDDDSWFRCKLAWRSADGDALLLVDRHGRKGVELTRRDLWLLLGHALAEIIGNGQTPLVERALSAVQQSLRQQPANVGSRGPADRLH